MEINWYIIGFMYLMFAFIMFSDTFLYDKIKNIFKKKKNRKIALNKAKAFLKPYTNPFGTLYLSNQFCSVNYSYGKVLFSFSKKVDEDGNKVSFLVEHSKDEILSVDEVWNILCEKFDYGTSLEDILKICAFYGLKIKTNYIIQKTKTIDEKSNIVVSNNIYSEIGDDNDELLDVNSCSEAELIALPGITIIIAKKIVKHREEKGYFDSVEDFLKVTDLKPHFATQIEKLITAKEVEIKIRKRTKLQRILDI